MTHVNEDCLDKQLWRTHHFLCLCINIKEDRNRFLLLREVREVSMVGEKSTDKISHNTLTSCDHLLSMFYLLLTILVIFSVFI